MIVDVPQILWHDNSARVMSLDFFPNSNYLATGSVQSDEDTGIRVSVRGKCLSWPMIPPATNYFTGAGQTHI